MEATGAPQALNFPQIQEVGTDQGSKCKLVWQPFFGRAKEQSLQHVCILYDAHFDEKISRAKKIKTPEGTARQGEVMESRGRMELYSNTEA